MRLGEYFTYEGEPYRETVAPHEHILAELDEQIASTASANEKRALRERRAHLVARHEAKSEAAIKVEDIGRLEDFKMDVRRRHEKQDKLDEYKKKLFFAIWANMSEVSLQKVKEHLTVPVWLEL